MLADFFAWPRTHPRAWAAVVAAVLAIMIGAPSVVIVLTSATGPGTVTVMLGIVIVHVAMLITRHHPVAAFICVVGGAVIMMIGTEFYLMVPSLAIVLVALYALSGHGSSRSSTIGLIVILAGAVIVPARMSLNPVPGLPTPAPAMLAALIASLALLAWVTGLFSRTRQAHLALLAERVREAERSQQRRADEARLAERARIAREFHDIVAHSLAVIVNLAKGARYAVETDPGQVTSALTSIEDSSRSALSELRGLVQVLQEPDSPYQPSPTLDDLPDLINSTRQAGLPVELHRRGEPRPVGPAIGLATYRLVQEGLTNVIKHAGPQTPTDVTLEWGSTGLTVTVRNAAPPASGTDEPSSHVSYGVGLTGVAERVSAAGGRCQHGVDADAGFCVTADLPYPGATLR